MMGVENDYATQLFTSVNLAQDESLECESHPLNSSSDWESVSRRSSSGRDELLIEPPSYADAVFSPYVGEDSSLTVPLSSTSCSGDLTIRVANPQKVQDSAGSSIVPGGGTYFTYLIITRTNLPEYEGTDFSVRRRFREVVALADSLAEAYRGYFIPPRPDKSVVESQVLQKQEFIEQRRAALEKYLGRLAVHPILKKSEELKTFLQSQSKVKSPSDFTSAVLDGAANLPKQLFGDSNSSSSSGQEAKGGKDFVRLFKELRQSVTNEWGGVKPLVIEEDKNFIERKEKLQDLEYQLTKASEQAEILVKAQEEIGNVMGSLGISLVKLGKVEGEDILSNTQRDVAVAAKNLGHTAVKSSRFHREANTQCVKHLDQLHEYLGLMQAVHGGFLDRSNALLTLQTHKSELASMQCRVEKLNAAALKVFGGDRSRNRKVDELKETIKLTEDACTSSQHTYDSIKVRNYEEIERYEMERQRDFFQMLKGFVQTQVGFAEKIAHIWREDEREVDSVMSASVGLY